MTYLGESIVVSSSSMTALIRFQPFLATILALAAFGPYVIGSVRTEQLAVYGAFVVLVPFRWWRFRPGVGLWLALPWGVLAFVAALGAALPDRYPMPYPAGDALAGLDNVLLPLVLMALVWMSVPPADTERALRAVAVCVVWACAVNGGVALLNTRIDLSAVLRPFWSAETVGYTTAQNALELGRFGGVFNQPAEAGVAYGVAGLLAVWLYHERPTYLLLVLTPIVLGGMLVASKVFIFGGIPVVVAYALWVSPPAKSLRLFVVAFIVLGFIQSGVFGDFNYMLRRLVPDDQSRLIEFYTAGRWNAESPLRSVTSAALDIAPLTGVGAAGWDVAYDSGWTEAIVVAGLLGAACQASVFLMLFALAARTRDTDRRRLTFALAIFLLGAQFGIGALTANRVATLIWLVVPLLVSSHAIQQSVRKEWITDRRTSFPQVRTPYSAVQPCRSLVRENPKPRVGADAAGDLTYRHFNSIHSAAAGPGHARTHSSVPTHRDLAGDADEK